MRRGIILHLSPNVAPTGSTGSMVAVAKNVRRLIARRNANGAPKQWLAFKNLQNLADNGPAKNMPIIYIPVGALNNIRWMFQIKPIMFAALGPAINPTKTIGLN